MKGQFIALCFACLPLCAWENHAIETSFAISKMPEIQNAEPVKAESLDELLAALEPQLATLLAKEEAWARAHVANYPPRPKGLAFAQNHPSIEARRNAFLKAIRVNPQYPFALFFAPMPGQPVSPENLLAPEKVTLMPHSLSASERFVPVASGQSLKAAEVFASATDEPDYGLDIGLWEDCGTTLGKAYRFGTQPFGNPKLEFSSQAPFHMGYFHEPKVIFLAAPYLTRTLPEYRIHLFLSLSRLAFKEGHPYWGWRFAGMGAHYIQDLTQPFHTTVLPGESTLRVLGVGLLDVIGIHGPKERMVEEVSDQHLAIENQVYCEVLKAQTEQKNNKLTNALIGAPKEKGSPYFDGYVREVLTAASHALSGQSAKAMHEILPKKKVAKNPNGPKPPCQINALSATSEQLLETLMGNFGLRTREFVRMTLAQ